MPSRALERWQTVRQPQLDEIRAAHTAVGGSGPGRRYATQQVNQAYALMLSGQFQGFCRDLHTEAADHFVAVASQNNLPRAMQLSLQRLLTESRKLDTGNPNPGNTGNDFLRFGLRLWPDISAAHRLSDRRRQRLEELNLWRNAIAHQNFDPSRLGGETQVQLRTVDSWRSACANLCITFDRVVGEYLAAATGVAPW